MDPTLEANKMLDETWTYLAGSNSVPVDPIRIANHLGIGVYEVTMPKDVAGSFYADPGQSPVITLNKDDAKNRRRFTCAHELGHYVKRHGAPGPYQRVDYRSTLASAGTDPDEVFANQFAAALLMPERAVRVRVGWGDSVVEMAAQFAVSPEAMSLRLKNLGLTID